MTLLTTQARPILWENTKISYLPIHLSKPVPKAEDYVNTFHQPTIFYNYFDWC